MCKKWCRKIGHIHLISMVQDTAYQIYKEQCSSKSSCKITWEKHKIIWIHYKIIVGHLHKLALQNQVLCPPYWHMRKLQEVKQFSHGNFCKSYLSFACNSIWNIFASTMHKSPKETNKSNIIVHSLLREVDAFRKSY